MKVLALLLLLAAAGNPGIRPEIRHFRYQRAIRNLTPAAGQACFAIDPAIFAHAAPQLADLRLYRGIAETPYALRLLAPAAEPDRQISLLNLGRNAGQTVFDAAMPPGNYRDIQLAIAGQNFIATVQVSGSQQQTGGAQTRIGSYTIFDLTREKLGRSTVLHLPLSDFPVLHFRIAGALAPDSVQGITVLGAIAGKPQYLTVAAASRVEQQGRESKIEFQVPAYTPVDRVVFVPAAGAGEFSRDARIGISQIAPPHSHISEEPRPPAQSFGNLLRIHRVADGHPIDEERLSIDAPFNQLSSKPTHWTVTVENGDDAPLPIASVRLEMVERELCFHAAAASAYTLYYGDSALAPPEYDYATLFTRQPGALAAGTGPESANPQYQPRPDSRPFTERHPWLLWAALVVVILLLAAIALRSAKRATPTAQ
ncbi:MAG: hypothetical protein ACRD25_06740 [Terracidiphilus sp.]